MARQFFENAVGPLPFIPAVTAAVPFSTAHIQSINGPRQPFVSAAKKSPEPLDELWKGRGSPRVESDQSPAPAAWTAEFGITGAATLGALDHQPPQKSALTRFVLLQINENVDYHYLLSFSSYLFAQSLFDPHGSNGRHTWITNVCIADDAGPILCTSPSY
jgi:hypothetical protein